MAEVITQFMDLQVEQNKSYPEKDRNNYTKKVHEGPSKNNKTLVSIV